MFAFEAAKLCQSEQTAVASNRVDYAPTIRTGLRFFADVSFSQRTDADKIFATFVLHIHFIHGKMTIQSRSRIKMLARKDKNRILIQIMLFVTTKLEHVNNVRLHRVSATFLTIFSIWAVFSAKRRAAMAAVKNLLTSL